MDDVNPFLGEHWPPKVRGTLGIELAVVQAAEFIIQAMAAGAVGGATFEYLKYLRDRHGKRKVLALRDEVKKLAKQIKRKPNVANRDIDLRVDNLFKDYE